MSGRAGKLWRDFGQRLKQILFIGQGYVSMVSAPPLPNSLREPRVAVEIRCVGEKSAEA